MIIHYWWQVHIAIIHAYTNTGAEPADSINLEQVKQHVCFNYVGLLKIIFFNHNSKTKWHMLTNYTLKCLVVVGNVLKIVHGIHVLITLTACYSIKCFIYLQGSWEKKIIDHIHNTKKRVHVRLADDGFPPAKCGRPKLHPTLNRYPPINRSLDDDETAVWNCGFKEHASFKERAGKWCTSKGCSAIIDEANFCCKER